MSFDIEFIIQDFIVTLNKKFIYSFINITAIDENKHYLLEG